MIKLMDLNYTIILWVVAAVLSIILLWLWGMYNSFISARNRVKTDYADIDVQIKRRASLIENLATLVREYAKHEKSTFESVAKARSAIESANSPKQSAAADNFLTSTLRSLFAVSEAYPKLLASENFQKLNHQIEQTENQIATYRETYNQTVLDFNTMVQTFPNLLAAKLFGFAEQELFEVTPQDATDVKLNK